MSWGKAEQIRRENVMAETKQEVKHTPKGYRIEGDDKYYRATANAELGPVDATDCEMELWQINTLLVEALEAFVAAYDQQEWPIENNIGLFERARAALQAAKQGR